MLFAPVSQARRPALLALIAIAVIFVSVHHLPHHPYVQQYVPQLKISALLRPSQQYSPQLDQDPPSPEHQLDLSQEPELGIEEHTRDYQVEKLSVSPLPVLSPEEKNEEVQGFIHSWEPPDDPSHWPPYDLYIDNDYNPNRWLAFDVEEAFYPRHQNVAGGKSSASDGEPLVYSPYPDFTSRSWRKRWKGAFQPCTGPRGKLLNQSADDLVRAYARLPHGFPKAAIGDPEASGVDINRCYDAESRYGPYGYYQDDADSATRHDWDTVRWGSLQDQCLRANRLRFEPHAREPSILLPQLALTEESTADNNSEWHDPGVPQHRKRTALLVRTWEGYQYTSNDRQAMRALVTELSLLSGGEYSVFLFINVKDRSLNLTDASVQHDFIESNVPAEFRDITVLWNEGFVEEMYPNVGDWQVYWHQFMPLQWFSKTHPEFEYIWNWETDARFTGNHYQFLEGLRESAKRFPRKYMWERSQRFYFPEHHGSYAQWLNDTDAAVERAMAEGKRPIWGPAPYANHQEVIGPLPPHSMEEDQFTWGRGEEADLITLQPMWDPRHTFWDYRKKIWNFVEGFRPQFTPEDYYNDAFDHPDFDSIDRRVYINTQSRLSKRLLHAMHLENLAGRAMQAEMWPATVALHHGLKAVYTPHPIWTDHRWPGWYLDAVFNAEYGMTAEWGQQRDSPYNKDREYNFFGWSWYYHSQFPKGLYQRWLGWKEGDDEQDGSTDEEVVNGIRKEKLCLPPMLLHPVKHVDYAEKYSKDRR